MSNFSDSNGHRPSHIGDGQQRMERTRERRQALLETLASTGVSRRMRTALSKVSPGHIRVLNYHGIHANELANFESQVKWLSERFDPVDATTLKDQLSGAPSLHRPGIVFTFDDGLLSSLNAAPILRRYGHRGWFFVIAGAPDVAPSDQVSWAVEKGVIGERHSEVEGDRFFANWDELSRLGRDHYLGSHTVNHVRMGPEVPPSVMSSELSESKATIEANAGIECEAFCWCGGEREAYSAEGQAEIRQAGYKLAFRTISKPVLSHTTPLAIGRTNVEASYSIEQVSTQVSGITDLRYVMKDRAVRKIIGSGNDG